MKWKERNIMQFFPPAWTSEGWALFFSELDEVLILSPAARTLKAGFIMWSSTACLIEMLNLFLSPASNASGVLQLFQSQIWTLLYKSCRLLYPWWRDSVGKWMGKRLKTGQLYTHPKLLWGKQTRMCKLIVVVLSFNGIFGSNQIEVDSLFTVTG